MFDVLVVGGGFYGCAIAAELARRNKHVCLVERESSLMTQASYCNQARVHGGYHYPRSFLTGVRSRDNFNRFISEFEPAIEKGFTKLYAIARDSKVTARQFLEFCKRIGAPIESASKTHAELFSQDTVESVFEVQEYAFNATKLAEILGHQLRSLKVPVHLKTAVKSVSTENGHLLVQTIDQDGQMASFSAKEVYLATYATLNEIIENSGLPVIPLRHEMTEMALVDLPEEYRNISVTVMDGPFWSLMPFPARGLMTLSHVRYTPHVQWSDQESFFKVQQSTMKSKFDLMVRDASRFASFVSSAVYRDSLWQKKTLLPRSDVNDSRPILFKRNYGIDGLNVVLGGKIDNVFDIIAMMDEKTL